MLTKKKSMNTIFPCINATDIDDDPRLTYPEQNPFRSPKTPTGLWRRIIISESKKKKKNPVHPPSSSLPQSNCSHKRHTSPHRQKCPQLSHAEQSVEFHVSLTLLAESRRAERGGRRSKASLIVRLNDDADIDEVKRLVEDVTKDYPFYARIDRGMILTVSNPFPKTAKGSIQKKATLDAYEKQLDELYENSG
jgi:hypothetical protein